MNDAAPLLLRRIPRESQAMQGRLHRYISGRSYRDSERPARDGVVYGLAGSWCWIQVGGWMRPMEVFAAKT